MVNVTGPEETGRQLKALAADLRAAGDKGLQREMGKAVNRSVKPLKAAVSRNAAAKLPQRGGLAAEFARVRFQTKRRSGRDEVRVFLVLKKPGAGKLRDLASLNRGRLRHPVFGNRRAWVNQAVRPGIYTDPVRDHADDMRVELLRSVDEIRRQIKSEG